MLHHTLETVVAAAVEVVQGEGLLLSSFLELHVRASTGTYEETFGETLEGMNRGARHVMAARMVLMTRSVHAQHLTRSFALQGDTSIGGVSLDIIDREVGVGMRLGDEGHLLRLHGGASHIQRALDSVAHFFLQVLQQEVGMTSMADHTLLKERTDSRGVVGADGGTRSGRVQMHCGDHVVRIHGENAHSRLYASHVIQSLTSHRVHKRLRPLADACRGHRIHFHLQAIGHRKAVEGDVRLVGGLLEQHGTGQVRHADVELDHGTTTALVHAPADEEGIADDAHVEVTRRFRSSGSLESHAGGRARVGLLDTLAVGETPGEGVALLSGETGDLQRKGELIRKNKRNVRGTPFRGQCRLPQKLARRSWSCRYHCGNDACDDGSKSQRTHRRTSREELGRLKELQRE